MSNGHREQPAVDAAPAPRAHAALHQQPPPPPGSDGAAYTSRAPRDTCETPPHTARPKPGSFYPSRTPRDTHQFVQRNIDIYVLQVMHARSANLDHRRVIQISHSPSANPEAFSSPVDASIPSWLEYKHMFYLFSPNNYSALDTQGSTNGTEGALWNTSLKTIACGTSPSRGRC